MKNLEYYMSLNYITVVVLEQCTDGTFCYFAQHPELLGCMSHGDTDEEAIENLSEARHLYLSDMLSRNMEPPEPWSLNEVSGMIIHPEMLTIQQPEPAISEAEFKGKFQRIEPNYEAA